MKSNSKPPVVIRKATSRDVALILSMIKELAEYERLTHQVVATEGILEESLFGSRSTAEVVIADYEGQSVGLAVYFYNFSTFLGRPGIYLEDLYVRTAFRGKGIGRRLLVYLAQLAKERRCGRLEWAVLNWNEPAVEFYKSLGAEALEEWTVFRLSGQALDDLGQGI